MTTRHLPVDTWMVVEQHTAWKHLALFPGTKPKSLLKRSEIEGTAVPARHRTAPV